MKIITAHPIALASYDHTHPKGTMRDNTHHPLFVQAIERIYGRKVTLCDMGSAGGGLVKDFLDAGHCAVGVEGSDYSFLRGRAEWATIPANLFTADITKPFHFVDEAGVPIAFDVLTAWEVMEHIACNDLPAVFDNLRFNLKPGGLFVCSIADYEKNEEGYHVTVHDAAWWRERFESAGFVLMDGLFAENEYPREANIYLTARKPA